jgi:hypothetical protein
MGTRGNNGGERPPEGGGLPDEGPLPDLPADWGPIVIPSDASSLDEESAAIRQEFQRIARRRRWRKRLHLPLRPHSRDDAPGLAVPLLIMSIAVVATLVSLFAVAWPGNDQRATRRPATTVTTVASISLADLVFIGTGGGPVRVGDVTPAAILLLDGCACQALVDETVRAAAPPVTVVLVGAAPAMVLPAPAARVSVKAVTDPNRSLRAAVPGLRDAPGPATVLVGRTGTVNRTLPRVVSVEEFRAELAALSKA